MDNRNAVYSSKENFTAELIRVKRTKVQFHQNLLKIILVLEGSLKAKSGFEINQVQEGDFFFINAGDVYSLWSEQESSLVGVLYLDIEKLESLIKYLPGIRFRNTFPNGSKQPKSKFDLVRERNFKRYLLEVLYLCNSYSRLERRELHDVFIRILGQACSDYDSIYFGKPCTQYISRKKVERIRRVLNYVKQNLSQNISLNDMARKEGVGKTYFTLMWKELMDLPFGEYVNYERVLYSERLLLFTDKTMIDISEECGFSDVKYYYKYFKHWYGKKPAEWKKDWLKYCSDEAIVYNLECDEAKSTLDKFSKKYITNTKKNNSRIYEQYQILNNATDLVESMKSNMLVCFDLFSPENLPEQDRENKELPEYGAINLFMRQVYEMGLGLQLSIRAESLNTPAYRDALEYILDKGEQHYGLMEMKNWEFQFLCKDLRELAKAKSFGDWIEKRLRGGKIRYILV